MRKIKVLRIIARLNIGGPAIHTILLSEGIDSDKFDTRLVCGMVGKDEGDMSYYAYGKDIKLIILPELRRDLNIYRDFIAFKKMLSIIKKERPDIIHTHTAKAGTLGRLAGVFYNFFFPMFPKAKLIHTFHGHVLSGYFGVFKTKMFILFERILSVFTVKIITVSEAVKNELITLGACPKYKIEVIPLGLELGKFLEIPLRHQPVINIGIIGRLVHIKNHKLFFEAAPIVLSEIRGIEVRFKVIGDGELRDELENLCAQLNIKKEVEFMGWQKDLTKVYSNLDIVALTSFNEGTPVSLIEAMASAKAVVATDVGGVKDLLGEKNATQFSSENIFTVAEKGILVETFEPRNFAAALVLLAKDDKLRQVIGLSSREHVRNKFAKERLIKDMEGLYNKVLIS